MTPEQEAKLHSIFDQKWAAESWQSVPNTGDFIKAISLLPADLPELIKEERHFPAYRKMKPLWSEESVKAQTWHSIECTYRKVESKEN